MSSVIGIDLGGTKIHGARFDAETFEVQAEERVPTHAEQKFEHVQRDMLGLARRLKTEDTVAVGMGVPGLVGRGGVIATLPNIPGAEGVALASSFEKELRLPVILENDANCFALAEAAHGSGKGHDIVIGITMGTGVGGGIVIHGELFRGHHGFAGEIGHMLLRPGEPPFRAHDQRGDVEQFLSGTAMGKRCAEAKRPKEYLEGEACAFLHPQLFREIAWMSVSLTHLLDPSIMIFGGSAGNPLKPHLSEIQKEMERWILPGTPLPKLAVATFRRAATRGAAILALRKVSK
ncbi:MAG: ROK family protein [Patescibacteria group bacterium]